MIKKYKKFLYDVILNIVSSILLSSAIQLIIFPLLSREMGDVRFGIIISLYGINNVIVNFLGNSLNNIRLIYDDETQEKGNFSYLLIIALVITTIMSVTFYYVYGRNLSFLENLITVLFTMLGTVKIYALVIFRISLEYNKLILTNFITILGYGIGLIVYYIIPIWSVIFLVGEILAILYIHVTTNIFEEKPKKTREFPQLLKSFLQLSGSNSIVNVMNYLDRFLINPILGPANLAVYYSASSVSKIISMVINPVTNVLLSYISKYKGDNNKKVIYLITGVSSLLLLPIYLLLNFISPYLISLLYPDLFSSAQKYIWIITLGTVLTLINSILNPLILKFCDIKYQMHIQTIYGLFYLVSATILSVGYGLMGFSIATVLSLFIKFCIMFYIGIRFSS